MTSATYTFGTPSSPTTALWRRLNRREAPVENIGALMDLPQYGGKGRKAEKVMPMPTVLVNGVDYGWIEGASTPRVLLLKVKISDLNWPSQLLGWLAISCSITSAPFVAVSATASTCRG